MGSVKKHMPGTRATFVHIDEYKEFMLTMYRGVPPPNGAIPIDPSMELGSYTGMRFIEGKAQPMNKRKFHKLIKDLDGLRRMRVKDTRLDVLYIQQRGLIWWELAAKTMEFATFMECAQAAMSALNLGKSRVEAGEAFMVTAKLLGV